MYFVHLLFFSSDVPVSGDDIIGKLIPDLWSFLVQFIAFIVLIIVVTFLIYKPVKKMLNKRKEHIEKTIKDANEQLFDAKNKNAEASQNIKNSYAEADKIISNAKKEAKKQSEVILNDTEEVLKAKKKQADADIEKAKQLAKEEIKKDAVEIAYLMSEKILEREVKREDDDRIINSLLGDDDK